MARKTSQFLTKEQRLKVYRKVKEILLEPGQSYGFCKAFEMAVEKTKMNTLPGKNANFYSRSAMLKQTYPEIFARKPKTRWENGSSYWFSPYNNHKAKSPRVRILNEAIKK